jgi:ATP/maltotriose-dependent transcriptional regulator MalT
MPGPRCRLWVLRRSPSDGRSARRVAGDRRVNEGSDEQANRIERYRLRLLVGCRERKLVAWVATGRSNEEIGQELFIGPVTVCTHVGRAMLKLRAIPRA